MSDAEISPLAQALGRVPCGLYIVTTTVDGAPIGFVGSFVMQQGIDPPTLSVAVGKGRDHLDAIRASGRFAVSVLDKESAGVMGGFFKPAPEGKTPFDELDTRTTEAGSVVLGEALAWLDCAYTGEHETGDHVVVFGTIEAGERAREGEPSVHLRKSGLGY